MSIRNLSEVPKEEQMAFINSVDRFLFDMDGVIWMAFVPIPDAQTCLENLKKLGKTVKFITNYAVLPRTVTHQRLKKHNFNYELEDILNPSVATVEYLRKNDFNKKIYAIATSHYKNELKKEGFELVEDPPQQIEETLVGIVENIKDDEEVGAVVYDFDLNLTFIKLQKALTYLKRPDCLFLTGGADKALPTGALGPLLGNFYHYQCLADISGRNPIQMAKPSKHFGKFVKERLDITNPERVVFIGDTINEDMGFAAESGYKKLLVLSGTSKIDDVKNWKHPESYKPDYYIENLTELNKIIRTNHKL